MEATMKSQFLGGVALSVAIFAMAGSAWANPKNSFSDRNTIEVFSSAFAETDPGGAGGPGTTSGGAGGAGGGRATATSESFNVTDEGVSRQTLDGLVTGNTIEADWDYADESQTGDANVGGDASIGGFSNAAGVSVASANTGAQRLNQQSVSLGAVGTVNFNQGVGEAAAP
jgi:hypothetical protein